MNSFEFCKQIGLEKQKAVKSYLEKRGHKVNDVSENKEYQDKDIDFLLTSPTGQTCSLEIKSDSKIDKTGNFFFEVSFNRKTGTYPGWYQKCKADYICFVNNNKGYILNFSATKKAIAEGLGESRKWYNYTDECYGNAILVNTKEAQAAGLIVKEMDLQ